MFEKTDEQLKELGALATTREIAQQPEIWVDALNIYKENLEAVTALIAKALDEAKGRLSVVFTGAGTSAYVGDTVAPYLRRVVDASKLDIKCVPTTDIVSAPYDFLVPSEPTVLVSFARSGNSPESLAAVNIAREVVDDIRFLNITCAPEGRLAVESADDPRAHTILIPRANDAGFAMTGSYTCMALMATLIFDPASLERKTEWVEAAARMGEGALACEDDVEELLSLNPGRVTYLGSASLSGLAREAQLKILELAAGQTATSFDSSMGYRHGPKSFVDGTTIVFVFVSNDPYTRQYDLDILSEIAGDDIALKTVAVQQAGGTVFEGDSFTFDEDVVLPEAYLALPFVVLAQTVALFNSLRVKNRPDTPSPTGTVNRVVKGVIIHSLA
jgi:tagatose-6-phosphate ketose/aldose isomerase